MKNASLFTGLSGFKAILYITVWPFIVKIIGKVIALKEKKDFSEKKAVIN